MTEAQCELIFLTCYATTALSTGLMAWGSRGRAAPYLSGSIPGDEPIGWQMAALFGVAWPLALLLHLHWAVGEMIGATRRRLVASLAREIREMEAN